jgi:hypothetical protein
MFCPKETMDTNRNKVRMADLEIRFSGSNTDFLNRKLFSKLKTPLQAQRCVNE